jgi:hypothetical protein
MVTTKQVCLTIIVVIFTHSAATVNPRTVASEDCLPFGLISSVEEQPHAKCVVWGEKLANQAVVPRRLRRYIHAKRSNLCENNLNK